jgi:glycosyltransferase involved in cell wall biosynthesis
VRHLVIVSRSDFRAPAGAAFSRLMNYARAVRGEPGLRVHLLSTRELRGPDPSRPWELEEGILAYPALPRERAGWWSALLARLSARPAKRRLIASLADFAAGLPDQVCVLIFPNMHDFFLERGLLRACRARGLRAVLEKNELELGLALHPRPLELRRLFDCLRHWLATPLALWRAWRHDRLVAEADAVIAISTRLERWSRRWNSQVLRVPILMDEVPPGAPAGAEPGFHIGFTGHVSQRKEGLITFLEALRDCLDARPDAVLDILGKDRDADARRVKRAVRRLGLESAVRFHGAVPLAQVPAWLARRHLLILPRPDTVQNRYGFSTKLAGYLAAGVPVLATAVGDTSHYLQDGVNGFLVPPGDRRELARRLRALLAGGEELTHAGLEGQRLACEHFHPSRYGPTLRGILFPTPRP